MIESFLWQDSAGEKTFVNLLIEGVRPPIECPLIGERQNTHFFQQTVKSVMDPRNFPACNCSTILTFYGIAVWFKPEIFARVRAQSVRICWVLEISKDYVRDILQINSRDLESFSDFDEFSNYEFKIYEFYRTSNA